ncbi:MAG: protein kinase [Gammaproteobacteria bacterium]|nr:protein kinase [Gammaproteobacteria bacterium]
MSTARIMDQFQTHPATSDNNPTPAAAAEPASSFSAEKPKENSMTLAELGRSVSYTIPYAELKRGDKIGSGHSAAVYNGTWRGITVAIKELSDKAYLKEFCDEANMLKKIQALSIPSVVQYAGFSENQGYSYSLVMEYLPLQDAFTWIEKNAGDITKDMPSRCIILKNTIAAIQHLHQHNILHRDLKWENLMLDTDYKIKLIDFGFALQLEGETATYVSSEITGTPSYMAPESINHCHYSKASDIFSFGSMLYTMLEQAVPFSYPGWSDARIKSHIAKGQMSPIAKTPPAFAALIKQCWNMDPSKRPTAEAVYEAIDAISQPRPTPSMNA